MFKKFFSLILLLGTLVSLSGAEPGGVITGKVVSASDNAPVIGASVIIQGTTSGTTTGPDGQFSLKAQPGDRLVVSFLGYASQTVAVGSRSRVEIVLHEDARMLDDVVVTGYTAQRKADLTGAISVVNMSDVARSNENNVMKALQGRVPGVDISADGNPGGKIGIKIRGMSNLASDSTPLYVIDGVPTQSGMHELNPSDIESIQVLKDAASASIYGSRAANGVIVITTKQGKAGEVRLNFDAAVTMSWYANKPDMLNAREYGQAMWQAMVNSGMDPNTGNSIGYIYDWGYDDAQNPVLYGMRVPKYLDKAHRMPASDTDWFDEISRTGVAQNYNLSLSGGTDRFSSTFSANYYDNKGTLNDTYFKRISVRMNSRYKLLGDIVTVGENFSVNRTQEVEADVDDVLELATQALPLVPVYMTDGNWGGPSAGMNDRHNPVRVLDAGKDNPYTFWRLFGNAYIDIQPLRNLHLKSSFGVDYGNYYQRNLTRSYISGEQFDEDRTEVLMRQRHWMKWTWTNTAAYDFEIGKHRFDALLGFEMHKQDNIEFDASKTGFDLETPDYMWLIAGTGEALATGTSSQLALLSYFAKVNYAYANKYLISATIRHDGSSKFGKNNRFGTFPSVSAGWRISEEPFMEGARKVLSELKIRASWGQTGNQNTISNTAPYSLYTSQYDGGGTSGGSSGTAYDIYGKGTGLLPSGFRKYRSGNDNLKWETSTQVDAGIDFGLFGNSLYGSFDYYVKDTRDLLTEVYYVSAAGEGSVNYANGASMRNRGFELLVGYKRETRSGFRYDVAVNVSRNRNEVVSLPESMISNYGGNGADDNILGRSIYSQYGYVTDGIFKTQEEVDAHAIQDGKGLGRIRFRDITGNEVVDSEDRTWLGTTEPDFVYGINIDLSYKNFDFSAFFYGVAGGVVYNSWKKRTDFWSVSQTGSNKGRRVLEAWSPTNPGSDIPALSYTDRNWEDRVSDYFLENQSFLKLRNIQIGYTLPAHLTKKIRMQKLRIYVSAQNLFTIKSREFTGQDPENPGRGYPIPVTLTTGLNISF